jgi:hypothetical protein
MHWLDALSLFTYTTKITTIPPTCTATLSVTTSRTSALLLPGSRCTPTTAAHTAQLPLDGPNNLGVLLLLLLSGFCRQAKTARPWP